MQVNGENLDDDSIEKMVLSEWCAYLNLNPFLLARYFQYRVEIFFNVIVFDVPLGKVKYHAITVEFQVRVSPHVHSFLWIIDVTVLSNDNEDEYTQFIDGIVKACVSDMN